MEPLEKLYELVFNATTFGITVTDSHHLLLKANAHFCKITGYSNEELEHQSIFKIIPPKIRPKIKAMYQDVAEGIAHPERIVKIFSKEGDPLVLSLTIQYVQEANGNYFINSFKQVDASDRYVNLFRETEKAAKIGGWEIDHITRQPLVSDAVREIYDLPPDISLSIEESLRFYLPEYRAVLNRALEDASQYGQPFSLTLKLISAKGNPKWVEVTCNPLVVEGHTVKLYGTIQDITEEKQQSLRIIESENRYKTLAENLPNGAIFTIDKNYHFTFIAGTELDALGTPSGTFKGKSIAEFNTPDQMEVILENYEKVFKGNTRSFEVNYREKTYLLSAMPLYDEMGEVEEIMVVSQNITEKYKAEKELEKQHRFLRQLIDSSPNLILVKDKEGRFVLVNKAFADFYHTVPGKLVGKTNEELNQHTDEQMEKFATEDKEIFQGRQSKIAIEEKSVSPDGTEYWFKTVKTPVVSENGTVDQVLMVASDITDQKQAALEIARSEAYLKAIFNSGEVGIFAIDKNLRTIFFNEYHGQRHKAIHGWELKKGDLIITNPALRKEYEPLFRRAFDGECFIIENEVSNFDNTIHWGEFSFSPIKMDGEIMGTLVMARDITARKATEQKVLDSEKYFRAIIENGFDCIVLHDKEGVITYASPNAKKIFGYTEEELLGRKGASFVHPDDLAERNHRADELQKGKTKSILIQERIRHKNGHYRWIEVNATNLLDEPSVKAMVGSIRDITDRMQAEQKQKKALRKEKMLNESLTKTNAELDQFVYSTSHNLRAPLTSMLGVIHILKSTKGMDQYADIIHLIERSIHQLDATIQEITDYARNNRIEVAIAPVNFEKIITDTLENLKFIEGAGRIKIKYKIDEYVNFHSDERRLKVIFNNLLSNAIQYQNSQRSQPRIDISVKHSRNNMIIKLQDNGIGIRPDQQDKIFNMFHRATDRSNGAGLGLYIVKEVLDKLKGTIKVDTVYGERTIFTVKIPNLCQSEIVGVHHP